MLGDTGDWAIVPAHEVGTPGGGTIAGIGGQVTEDRLLGGWQTDVHLSGEVVYRSPGPQSATVLALLRHLESAGFEAAPRVVGTGFAPDGRETLRYIEGRSPQPAAWSDEALVQIGGLLRGLHRATATFRVDGAVWRPWFARSLPGDDPVIGHGDLGPWNVLARGGLPVAFIDWDNAGPVDAMWELAQVAWLNVQLHDDDVAERNGLPSPARRAAQLRLLVDAYGLDSGRRGSFVDRIAEFAVHAARQEAVDAQVTPKSGVAIAEDGFPVLWAITWRTRSASWILRNRQLLSKALS